MDREKTERIVTTDGGQVPGRNQQNNRYLSPRLRPVSGYDKSDGQRLDGGERSVGQTRSDFESGSDSYNDQLLDSEERGNRQLCPRSSSVIGSDSVCGQVPGPWKLHDNRQLRSLSRPLTCSDSYNDQSPGPEEIHDNRQLRSKSRSATGPGSYIDQPLGPGELHGNRHLGSRSRSVSGSDSNDSHLGLLYLEEEDKKQIRSSSSSLSMSTSDEDHFSDGEDQNKRYTYSSSSFTSLSDSDDGQFSDRDIQGNDQRNSTKKPSSGFCFHSMGDKLYNDDDEDEIQEYIEAHARRRDDSLSYRNQIASVKSAVVTESLLYERQKSRKPPASSGDFKHADVISVSHLPIDSSKKVKTALYTNHAHQDIDSPSTNTDMLRPNGRYESKSNETSASIYPRNEKENLYRSINNIDMAKAGDGTETNRIVCPREANSKFQAGRDMKNQGVESLPDIHKSSPNIHKSPRVPNNGNQRKSTERLDQMEGFVTLRQSIMLQRRQEEVHPKVDAPDPVGSERTVSSHAMETQTHTEKPNCHDLELFENFYLLSQNSRIIKKCRHTDKPLRWLQLNGAGQMCRIDSGTLVAVIQTTVGIVCLQTDPKLIIMYKIETRRQYLSICHLFTFKITNEPRQSNRHSFAVTCTERREDSGNLDELILLVKPSVSQFRPNFQKESCSKLNASSLSGICTMHFIKKTHLVVGCRDRVAFMLFSNLTILWICKLDRSPTDIAFWDPVILVCVPEEYKVKAIDIENGKIVNENILARTDDQGLMPHRISVCGNSFLVKLYSRDSRKEVKIVEYTRDDTQVELLRRERYLYK